MVAPCKIKDAKTTTKATLKKVCAPGTPAITGNTANTIGTAPRKPTQEMNLISCDSNLNGLRHNHTATGRATIINTTATPKAGHKVASTSEGVTNRPSNKNMPACDNQA